MYGKMIQKLRKAQKMSQSELGAQLGIGVSSVSMWESEKREPDLSNITAMAELFNVTVDYLLTGNKAVEAASLTSDEAYMLTLVRQLPKEQQYEIKGIIKGMLMGGGND